jgi:hypothetical protein
VADHRKAGIGYAQKYDMTKTTTRFNPAPDSYAIHSDVELNKTKNKGFQFGVSRDVIHLFFKFHKENVAKWHFGWYQ